MDSTLLPFALLCFTSFFTLTNPLGTMPVFLTMTHGMTDKERQSIVQRATIVSFVTLMVFVFAGQFLFKFFGISTDGFRIAGGVIIFNYSSRDTNVVWSRSDSECYCFDAGCSQLRNERDFDRNYRTDLSADFLYSPCFHEIGECLGRDGE